MSASSSTSSNSSKRGGGLRRPLDDSEVQPADPCLALPEAHTRIQCVETATSSCDAFRMYQLRLQSELNAELSKEEESYFSRGHEEHAPASPPVEVEDADHHGVLWCELGRALDLEEEEYFHSRWDATQNEGHPEAGPVVAGLPAAPHDDAGGKGDREHRRQPEQPVAPVAPHETEAPPPVTTVMIRNITCKYTPDKVRQFLDASGLQGAYDFFYLPMNRCGAANLGYCFVNFRSPESVEDCRAALHGRALGQSRSTKTIEVTIAQVQGLANLRKHFRKKLVLESSHAPMFL